MPTRLFGLRRLAAASLKTRVLLLTVMVFVAVMLPAYVAFEWIVETTMVELGTLFAEKQVLFDRYRGLASLMREVSLAETLVRSPAITEWAVDEDDALKRQRGLDELERYRLSFQDRSYFLVLDRTGHYYFNDAANGHAAATPRYTLRRENPRDGWYFTTMADGPGCRLNVDRDDTLEVTKVWINCVIMRDGQAVGVLGTGVDFTTFIHEVVDIPQRGVQGMFIDRAGAIQAHRDASLVDFHTLTNDTKAKKTIFALIDRAADQTKLAATMRRLAESRDAVESQFIRIGGKDYLVGLGYLDRVGWFNVTLMDVDAIIRRDLFAPIAALLAIIAAAAVATMMLAFRRGVIDRLARLEASVRRMGAGDFAIESDDGADEIGRLSRAFATMAGAVADHTGLLEAEVAERTEQLRQLAHADPLTGMLNRRGVVVALASLRERIKGTGAQLELLLIDFDLFKSINDAHGHHSGDQVLAEAAKRLGSVLGPDDLCGRWGGDEFIVIVAADHSAAPAGRLIDALRNAIGKTPIRLADGATLHVSISIGACRLEPDQALDDALARADAALYRAKRAGGGRAVVCETAPADTTRLSA